MDLNHFHNKRHIYFYFNIIFTSAVASYAYEEIFIYNTALNVFINLDKVYF